MSNPPSTTGRLLDDDMPPPYGNTPRPRPTAVPSNPFVAPTPPEPPRLGSPSAAVAATNPPPLQPAQRACYEALGLALQEGHVFAAVTGPEGSGKTTVLEAVLADRHDRALRCIRISDPDKVPARLAAQIEQVAYAEAGKPENLDRHVVLAIDDAHSASNELLRCLSRLAAMREPGRRVPQILLVGRPELWARLATEEFAPLARRLAIRAVLPTLQDEQDPWASLEQEVSQTMSQLRSESETLPAPMAGPTLAPVFDRAFHDHYPAPVEEAGMPFDPSTVAPPTDFALFPDPPPRVEPQQQQRESKRRLLVPLGCLMAAVAVFTFALSYFDWPGLFDDMPWADSKPAAGFAFTPPSNQTGLPQTPSWAQPAQHTSPVTPPRGAPPPPPTAAVPAQTAMAPRVSGRPPPPSEAAIAPKLPEPAAVAALAPPIEPAKPAEPPKPVVTQAAEPDRIVPPSPQAASASPPVAQAGAAAPEVAIMGAATPEPTKPIAPPPAEPSTQVAAVTAPPLAATAPRSTRASPIAVVKPAPLPPAIVGLLLRRGDEQLAIGDVSAARLLFERAAESGNAQGAFRLARTYDASFLPAADAATLANRNEARVWYGRAASLGDRDAAARLRDLNEGH